MDPITGAVVALVIWLFAGGLGATALFWLGVGIGFSLGGDDGGAIGAFLGWLAAIVWSGFSVVMLILQIVNLVQLIVGG